MEIEIGLQIVFLNPVSHIYVLYFCSDARPISWHKKRDQKSRIVKECLEMARRRESRLGQSCTSLQRGRVLERRDCDRHDLDSKPTRAILLCLWKRHFTVLYPAWWSWRAILNKSPISIKNFKRTAISWHLRKQVGVIACPMYLRLHRFPVNQEDKHREKIKKSLRRFSTSPEVKYGDKIKK